MPTLRADRRLYLSADKSEVVEEGDHRAAFLLAGVGRNIEADAVSRYKLSLRDGKVVVPGQEKPEPEPEDEAEEKQAEAPEDKQAEAPEDKSAPAPKSRKRRRKKG